MKRVLVTGASGFIGSALCSRLASGNKIIGVDITDGSFDNEKIAWEQADLTVSDSVAAICEKYSPDVVIHCAGIAHQKIGAVDYSTYIRVNSEVTEKLAEAAAESNPDVCFVFLSSVSVYGENPQITPVPSPGATGQAQITQNERDTSRKGAKALMLKTIQKSRKGAKSQRGKKYPQITQNDDGVGEDRECWPSSDYAVSKVDAERRLVALSDEGIIRNLIILRLAPVYDRDWSLNLDRRVFAPGKLAYLRFGSGSQRMSALARPNLVEFIVHILQSTDYLTQRRKSAKRGRISTPQRNSLRIPQGRGYAYENNLCNQRNLRINVCDAEAYEFNRIIDVFKQSGIQPNRPVISVPLSVVWFATRIAGVFFSNKKEWIHSCYDKLASDLVFENGRMMGTGFRARCSLETIFDPQMASRKGAKTLRYKDNIKENYD